MRATALVVALLLSPLAAPASPWDVPPEGSCRSDPGLQRGPPSDDAQPFPFAPGELVTLENLGALRDFLPAALWTHRERFFYEGIRLEIGPCFRDYSAPGFFGDATERYAGRATLRDDGGLESHVAGLPFRPADIDAADPRAGRRWAWNFAHRYQAAGFRGDFRITDLLGLIGRAEPFTGEIFRTQLSQRADIDSARGHAVSFANEKQWVAGGLFFTPFNAREYAWRQYRAVESQEEARRSDDLHVYLPQLRRVRRLAANNVEGLYMPTFAVGITPAGGGGGIADAGAASSGSVGTIYAKRSGFEGLEIRPQLYDVALLGVQDVLAPINASRPMYPVEKNREFGPWGLSFANDRWDLRRSLVLEFSRTSIRDDTKEWRIVFYVDLQTLHPLYYVSYEKNGEILDVGTFAGRWSEDREGYPRWPDDPARPVRVIDSVAAAFANIDMQGSWRRESWEMVGVPLDGRETKQLISVKKLTQRR